MRRTDVEKTKEILRLHDELGLSQREIAVATGCSLGTVSGILSKAKAAGITYPVEMTAKQLGSALFPPKDGTGEGKHSEPELECIHHEMQRKGVTLTLLWEEYKTAHPDGLMYTQFCQRYRDFRKQNDVYMRKQYKAGERLETDWAGLTLPYGEGQKAYFFVAALPASACLYVEPFRDISVTRQRTTNNITKMSKYARLRELDCSAPKTEDSQRIFKIPQYAYFYLPDTPQKTKRLEKVDYRTFGNWGMGEMSRELRWFLRDIEDRRDAMIRLYKEVEIEPTPFTLNISVDTAEDMFGFMTGAMHGITLRCIRKSRAEFNIGLTNLVYNLCRYSILKRQRCRMG